MLVLAKSRSASELLNKGIEPAQYTAGIRSERQTDACPTANCLCRASVVVLCLTDKPAGISYDQHGSLELVMAIYSGRHRSGATRMQLNHNYLLRTPDCTNATPGTRSKHTLRFRPDTPPAEMPDTGKSPALSTSSDGPRIQVVQYRFRQPRESQARLPYIRSHRSPAW